MLVARLEIEGKQERRGALRFCVNAPTTARAAGSGAVDVMIANLSRSGFLIVTDQPLTEGMALSVSLGGENMRDAFVVRRDSRGFGCQFMVPLTREEMARAFGAMVAGEPDGAAEQEEAHDRRAWRFWVSLTYGLAGATLIVFAAAWLLLLR